MPQVDVIEEIVRRGREGIAGNSLKARAAGVKLGLVVEGGAMRGIISGGALVAMERLGLTQVFDSVYGESAGATNAAYFLSGQAAFGIRIYTEDLSSLRFANPFRPGRMLDLDYAYDVIVKTKKPLDVEKVLASPSNLFIPVTDAQTGKSRVVDAKKDGVPLLTLLKASGALVPLYNRPVLIDGVRYTDGGIANPVPVQTAIDDGCTHILVLLTQPPEYRAKNLTWLERAWIAPFCRPWTEAFRDIFFTQHILRYNQSRALALGQAPLSRPVNLSIIAPASTSPRMGARGSIVRAKLEAAMNDAIQKTVAIFSNPTVPPTPTPQ